MDNNKFIRSVRLKESACRGCINCIKYCPTQAIRVHNGKAHIIDRFCIDCGRCIRYCPHHAKIPVYDPLSVINNFKYTVALPAPSLYAQYNNLTNADIVLNALLKLGFDDVYEVSAAAELVSEASRSSKGLLPINDLTANTDASTARMSTAARMSTFFLFFLFPIPLSLSLSLKRSDCQHNHNEQINAVQCVRYRIPPRKAGLRMIQCIQGKQDSRGKHHR